MTLEQINENPEFLIMITVCSLFFALGVVSMSPWLRKQYSKILILQRKYFCKNWSEISSGGIIYIYTRSAERSETQTSSRGGAFPTEKRARFRRFHAKAVGLHVGGCDTTCRRQPEKFDRIQGGCEQSAPHQTENTYPSRGGDTLFDLFNKLEVRVMNQDCV